MSHRYDDDITMFTGQITQIANIHTPLKTGSIISVVVYKETPK